MRSDWMLPLCTGEERLKDASGAQGAPDAEARGAAAPRHPARRRTRATWCSTRSSAPAPPAPWPSGSAAASSASSATQTTSRRRKARIAARSSPAGAGETEVTGSKRVGAARPVRPDRRGGPASRRATALFDAKRATPRACAPTAACRSATLAGSIHKIGAHGAGAPACNGWTYWHFLQQDKPAPIDALRTLARERLREGV